MGGDEASTIPVKVHQTLKEIIAKNLQQYGQAFSHVIQDLWQVNCCDVKSTPSEEIDLLLIR